MKVIVEIEGMDFFKAMTNQAADFRKPLLEKGVPILHKTRAEQFDAESAYVGGALVKWAPFKVKPKGTSRGAGGRFTTRKLLNKTGRMRRAMTTHSAPATIEVGSDYLTFRSHIPYEEFHQKGVPSRNLPARPITFDKPKAQEEIQRELLAWVVQPVDPQAAESARRGA